MNRIKQILILLCLAASCITQSPDRIDYYSLSGEVMNSDSGAPCVGVTVTAVERGASTTTSREGRFLFPKLAPGTFSISLESESFHSKSETVELNGDLTLSLGMIPVKNHLIPASRVVDFGDSLTIATLSVVNAWWIEKGVKWNEEAEVTLKQKIADNDAGDPSAWSISWDCPWLDVSPGKGITELCDNITLSIDRDLLGLGTFQTVLRFNSGTEMEEILIVAGQADYCKPLFGLPTLHRIKGRKASAFCDIMNMGQTETKAVPPTHFITDGYGFQYSENSSFQTKVSSVPCREIFQVYREPYPYMCADIVLEPGKTYFLRAYGANSRGRSYSDAVSFSTPTVSVPELSGVNIISNTAHWIDIQAEILSDGNADIEEVGFCWAVYANPSTDDWIDECVLPADSIVTGRIRDLEPNHTYYVRAYAKNEAGTAYGPVTEFTTTGIIIQE